MSTKLRYIALIVLAMLSMLGCTSEEESDGQHPVVSGPAAAPNQAGVDLSRPHDFLPLLDGKRWVVPQREIPFLWAGKLVHITRNTVRWTHNGIESKDYEGPRVDGVWVSFDNARTYNVFDDGRTLLCQIIPGIIPEGLNDETEVSVSGIMIYVEDLVWVADYPEITITGRGIEGIPLEMPPDPMLD